MGADCLMCYSVCVTLIAILYVLLDVNYFLRIIFTIGWGKLFDKKKKIEETTQIYGKVYSPIKDFHFIHKRFFKLKSEINFI